jgi:geranylgeranylglycerol-phosphate geranylgeranyltransferase
LKKDKVSELLRKNFTDNGGDTTNLLQFSKLKSIVFIARPTVSAISGLISSLIYFKYTNNFIMSEKLFVVVFLTTCFGFSINDYFDIEKDKINHPERILPQGFINPKLVVIFCSLLALMSLWFSSLISPYVLCINLITLTLLSVYSIINNHFGVIANILTSFCSALALLITKIDLNFDLVFAASISTFLVILSREIIFDIQDIDGDKWVSKTSIPILFGISNANKISGFLLFTNTAFTIFCAIYFNSTSYLIYVGIISNILLWSSFLYYVFAATKKSEILFTNLTRLAFLLLIPAIILSN